MSTRRPADPSGRSAGRRRDRLRKEKLRAKRLARRQAKRRRNLKLLGLFVALAGLEVAGLMLWNWPPLRRLLQPPAEIAASPASPGARLPTDKPLPDPFGAIASASRSDQAGSSSPSAPLPAANVRILVSPSSLAALPQPTTANAFALVQQDLERQLGHADRPASDHRYRYARLGLTIELGGQGASRSVEAVRWERPEGHLAGRPLDKLAAMGLLDLPARTFAGPGRPALEELALVRPGAVILGEPGGKRVWVMDRERRMVMSFDARGLASLVTGKPSDTLARALEKRLNVPAMEGTRGWSGLFKATWFAGRPLVSADFIRTRRPGSPVEIDLQLKDAIWNPDNLVEVVRRECMQERAGSSPGVRVKLRDPAGQLVLEGDWFPDGDPTRRVGDPDAANGVSISWN